MPTRRRASPTARARWRPRNTSRGWASAWRLLIVTGCPLRLGAVLGVGACTGAGALAAQLLPELESDPAGLLLRAAVFSGVFILAACLSGTAERCLPPSLRGLLYLPERSEKTQAVR